MDDAKEVIEAARAEQRKERTRAAAETAAKKHRDDLKAYQAGIRAVDAAAAVPVRHAKPVPMMRLPEVPHEMNQGNSYTLYKGPLKPIPEFSASYWADKAKQQAMSAGMVAARDAMENGVVSDAEFAKRLKMASHLAMTAMKAPNQGRTTAREIVAQAVSGGGGASLPWDGQLLAAAFEIKTLMRDVDKVMKLDPAQWKAETYAYPGQWAGKHIVLQLEVQNDVTPVEVYRLMQLRHGDVHGNIIAFIMDHELIRHFVDVTPRNDVGDSVAENFQDLMDALDTP